MGRRAWMADCTKVADLARIYAGKTNAEGMAVISALAAGEGVAFVHRNDVAIEGARAAPDITRRRRTAPVGKVANRSPKAASHEDRCRAHWPSMTNELFRNQIRFRPPRGRIPRWYRNPRPALAVLDQARSRPFFLIESERYGRSICSSNLPSKTSPRPISEAHAIFPGLVFVDFKSVSHANSPSNLSDNAFLSYP